MFSMWPKQVLRRLNTRIILFLMRNLRVVPVEVCKIGVQCYYLGFIITWLWPWKRVVKGYKWLSWFDTEPFASLDAVDAIWDAARTSTYMPSFRRDID